MDHVEKLILSALTDDSPLPTDAGDRVYGGGVLPPGIDKGIVFQRISSVPVLSLSGSSGGMERVRMQIDCWAPSYADAKAMDLQVQTAMAGAAASFRSVPDSSFDDFENDTQLYRVSRDYFCWQNE